MYDYITELNMTHGTVLMEIKTLEDILSSVNKRTISKLCKVITTFGNNLNFTHGSNRMQEIKKVHPNLLLTYNYGGINIRWENNDYKLGYSFLSLNHHCVCRVDGEGYNYKEVYNILSYQYGLVKKQLKELKDISQSVVKFCALYNELFSVKEQEISKEDFNKNYRHKTYQILYSYNKLKHRVQPNLRYIMEQNIVSLCK